MKLKKKRPVFRGIVFMLSIMMIMTCFTGCKYSPKLHELIQDRFDHLLDTRSAKEFENDFNRVEKSDEVKAKEQDETSERKKEENEEKPVESDNPNTEQQTVPESIISTGNAPEASSSETKSEKAVSSGQSTDNNTSTGSSGSAAVQGTGAGSGGTGSGSGGTGNSGSGSGGTGGSGSGNGGTGDNGEGSGGTGESGIEIVPATTGTRQIVDSRGEYVEGGNSFNRNHYLSKKRESSRKYLLLLY